MFAISGLKISGVVAASVASALFASALSPAQAQITQAGITVTAPEKGTTQNLSLTNGSITSLAVGNTTSFGAASNLTLSKGLTGISRTVLVPSSVAINSDIGDNALGQTTINISNLAANGDGGSITPDSESGISSGTIDLEEGTQYASGNAFIEGMGASVLLDIDPGNASAPGEASFFATVFPNINGLDACQPTHEEACPYVTNEDLVSGNTGANASLSTNTNIDINANSFVNTFAQSF
jgi:hypothetical protein